MVYLSLLNNLLRFESQACRLSCTGCRTAYIYAICVVPLAIDLDVYSSIYINRSTFDFVSVNPFTNDTAARDQFINIPFSNSSLVSLAQELGFSPFSVLSLTLNPFLVIRHKAN